jgi:hypothetical protein
MVVPNYAQHAIKMHKRRGIPKFSAQWILQDKLFPNGIVRIRAEAAGITNHLVRKVGTPEGGELVAALLWSEGICCD